MKTSLTNASHEVYLEAQIKTIAAVVRGLLEEALKHHVRASQLGIVIVRRTCTFKTSYKK